MHNIRRRAALFDLRTGEGHLVGLVVVYGFLLEVGRTLTGTISSTLFLTRFRADTLAYVYLGSAIAVPLTGMVYLKLQARLPLVRVIGYTLAVLSLSLVGLRAALAVSDASWLIAAVLLWFTILYVLVSLAFWNLSAQLFDLRQGKRVFGLLNAGAEAGQAVSGLLTPLLVLSVGATNMLLVAAAGLGSALVVKQYITRHYPVAPTDQPAGASGGTTSGAAPFRSRYVRLLLLLVVLSYMAYLILDTVFFSLAQTYYHTPEQIASLVGMTVGVTSVLTLASQVLVSGPFTRRYGVIAGLLILPTGLIVGTLLLALTGVLLGPVLVVFWIATLTRITDRVVRYSIDEVSVQVMYQPLPTAQRPLVQTIAEGGMKPLAAGLAGLSILALTRWLGVSGIGVAIALLAVALGWLAVAWLLGREYPAMLLRAITTRQLSGTTLALNDSASIALLEQRLHSSHPGEVLYALDVLEVLPGADHDATFGRLLDHPDAALRHDVVARIERLHRPGLAHRLRERLAVEDEPPVQAAVLRTIGALDHDAARDLLVPFATHPDPRLRHGALLGLLRSGSIEGMLVVCEWLNRHVRSSDPADRTSAARFIGEAGLAELYGTLAALLNDNDHGVRRAAIKASGVVKHERLWPLVLPALAQRTFRADAATALAQGGAAVVPLLRAALETRAHDFGTSTAMVRVLGRIGGPVVVPPLLACLGSSTSDLRTAALLALQRSDVAVYSGAEADLIRLQIDIETAHAARLLASMHDLGSHDATALLREALHYRLAGVRVRIWGLLSLVHDAATVRRVQRSCTSASSEQRAYGMELLDQLLPAQLKATVLPLLDDLALADQLERLKRRFPQPQLGTVGRLEQMLADSEDVHTGWIGTCAAYGLHQLTTAGQPQSNVEEVVMPVLLEQVLLLKTVRMFTAVPDEILADIAARLVEDTVPGGTTVVEKGTAGECIYIIERGTMRVHDGDRTLNVLGAREIFGEMAVLNAAPRVASVTAVDDAVVFRLDQDTLFELMADHPTMLREVVRTLSGYLEQSLRRINELDAQARVLNPTPDAPSATKSLCA